MISQLKKPLMSITYFPALTCFMWLKTLMMSRIRRGASSILLARQMQAMET